MFNRIFLIVLDSFGIGNAPDADKFGDKGSFTLKTCAESEYFNMPNMKKLGLFNIDGIDFLPKEKSTESAYGRLCERSLGKDSTTGHWEIAGIISEKPMPTYPNGFPKEIISEFEMRTGRKTICNMPFSGTEVIKKYGEKQKQTGALIVYTSTDSVFQIAANNQIIPLEELYKDCKIARKILCGENSVGRVIARPFEEKNGEFIRTSERHDFSLEPPEKTMLDLLDENGFSSISVGKIYDIFAHRGISDFVLTRSNSEGMKETEKMLENDFNGLCFTNLVDFDMLYGHRNNIDGYAKALSEFDRWVGKFITKLGKDDCLIITADHGCDPSSEITDHSRECVPLIIYGDKIKPQNLGTKPTFAVIGKTILDNFNIKNKLSGESLLKDLI